MQFSFPLFLSGIVNYFSRNADNFFIGKFLGAEQLGYYSRSYSIMMLPVSKFSRMISSVVFPTMSIIQDENNQIKNIFFKITRIMSLTSLIIFGLIYVNVELAVNLVFGDKWILIVPIVKLLSIVGFLQFIGTVKHNIFLVKARTKLILKLNLLKNLFLIPIFFILSKIGLIHLVLGYLFFVLFQLITSFIVSNILKIISLNILKISFIITLLLYLF